LQISEMSKRPCGGQRPLPQPTFSRITRHHYHLHRRQPRPIKHHEIQEAFRIKAINTSSKDGGIGLNTAGPNPFSSSILSSSAGEVCMGDKKICSVAPEGSTLSTPSAAWRNSLAALWLGLCNS